MNSKKIFNGSIPMEETSLADLLELVEKGDELAAAELYQRYVDRLVRLAQSRLSRKLGRRLDADDVVQSACRSFFRRVQDGRYQTSDEDQLWHLLAAITVNKARKAQRRHTARKRSISSEQSAAASTLARISPTVVAQPPSPEEALALIEETEQMMACLTTLQRSIVERRLQGVTTTEIATELGCSERTVHRALERARSYLERSLQNDRS